MRWVQKYSARDYSTICLAQGTQITLSNGKTGGCDRGSCPCREGQICEIRTVGSDYLCHDTPGTYDKKTGDIQFTIPTESITDSQGYSTKKYDSGTECTGSLPLDLYTRLKEDYSKAYYNPDLNKEAARPKWTLSSYDDGAFAWIKDINYNFWRSDYSGLCTGKKGSGKRACGTPVWPLADEWCNDDEICEKRTLTNVCRKVPRNLIPNNVKSAFTNHYPKGSIGYP
jgi:hypothetical protein